MEKSQNPLIEWLTVNRVKKRDFAAAIGVTPGRVSQILSDGVSGLDLARRIEAVTGGQVPIDVWLEKPIDVTPIPGVMQ